MCTSGCCLSLGWMFLALPSFIFWLDRILYLMCPALTSHQSLWGTKCLTIPCQTAVVLMVYCWVLNPLRVESFKAPLFSFPQETAGRLLPPPLQPHVCYLWLLWVCPACSLQDGGWCWGSFWGQTCGQLPITSTPCGESSQGHRQFVLGCALGSMGTLCPFGETDLSIHTHFLNGDSAMLCRCTRTTVLEDVRDEEKGFWVCVLCPYKTGGRLKLQNMQLCLFFCKGIYQLQSEGQCLLLLTGIFVYYLNPKSKHSVDV